MMDPRRESPRVRLVRRAALRAASCLARSSVSSFSEPPSATFRCVGTSRYPFRWSLADLAGWLKCPSQRSILYIGGWACANPPSSLRTSRFSPHSRDRAGASGRSWAVEGAVGVQYCQRRGGRRRRWREVLGVQPHLAAPSSARGSALSNSSGSCSAEDGLTSSTSSYAFLPVDSCIAVARSPVSCCTGVIGSASSAVACCIAAALYLYWLLQR